MLAVEVRLLGVHQFETQTIVELLVVKHDIPDNF